MELRQEEALGSEALCGVEGLGLLEEMCKDPGSKAPVEGGGAMDSFARYSLLITLWSWWSTYLSTRVTELMVHPTHL